ncbi:MAG: TraR/DksA C4-type zinc finger protein [Desulfobulbaceae bacterium]|jgi:DnaK suppressor protein|nr:TraR/DksA C4-type zinc finger protein [Desulfobulbaceae bacterium]
MNDRKRAEIKQRISTELIETKEKIESLRLLVKPISPDNAVGRLSRMEAIGTKAINEAALGNATCKLGRLQHALTKVDDPDFGSCYECGNPIPLGRILLMPESTLCVGCAEELEGS